VEAHAARPPEKIRENYSRQKTGPELIKQRKNLGACLGKEEVLL